MPLVPAALETDASVILLFSLPSLTKAHWYIWNCGRCCAGRAKERSRSLQTLKYKLNQEGLLWAARPLYPALTTQEESKVDSLFRWELKIANYELLKIVQNCKIKKKKKNSTKKNEMKMKNKSQHNWKSESFHLKMSKRKGERRIMQ